MFNLNEPFQFIIVLYMSFLMPASCSQRVNRIITDIVLSQGKVHFQGAGFFILSVPEIIN
jgi:hypothetical protein